MLDRIAKLIDLKSIVTLLMTGGMILLLSGAFNPSDAVFALFSTTYGSIITYFFMKKSNDTPKE